MRWGHRIIATASACGLFAVGALAPAPSARAGSEDAPWWNELLPPHLGVLLRAYEPPPTPFAAGHRGVDFQVEAGVTVLVAAIDGVASTGVTPGNRYVTIETADHLTRVTLSYLSSVMVASGRTVIAGDPIAIAGAGHDNGSLEQDHVHLSLRFADVTDPSGWRYVDPMPYLRRYVRRVRWSISRIVFPRGP